MFRTPQPDEEGRTRARVPRALPRNVQSVPEAQIVRDGAGPRIGSTARQSATTRAAARTPTHPPANLAGGRSACFSTPGRECHADYAPPAVANKRSGPNKGERTRPLALPKGSRPPSATRSRVPRPPRASEREPKSCGNAFDKFEEIRPPAPYMAEESSGIDSERGGVPAHGHPANASVALHHDRPRFRRGEVLGDLHFEGNLGAIDCDQGSGIVRRGDSESRPPRWLDFEGRAEQSIPGVRDREDLTRHASSGHRTNRQRLGMNVEFGHAWPGCGS